MTLLDAMARGFLLGLGTGPLCFLTCLPLVLPLALARAEGEPRRLSWIGLAEFLGGRLAAYSAAGLLSGLASSAAGPPARRLMTATWTALSLVLIAHGASGKPGRSRWCGAAARYARARWFPFALGVGAGLSACPPFLLAVAYATGRSGQILNGLAFFLSFFLATALYVLPVGLLGYLPRRGLWEGVGRASSVLAGTALLFQGVTEVISWQR